MTITISPHELDNIKEAVAFANTPNFLYRRVSESEALSNVVGDHSVADLLAELSEIANARKLHLDCVARAYLLIAAIVKHGDASAQNRLDTIRLDRLEWSAKVIEYGRLDRKATDQQQINPPLTVPSLEITSQRSSDSIEIEGDME